LCIPSEGRDWLNDQRKRNRGTSPRLLTDISHDVDFPELETSVEDRLNTITSQRRSKNRGENYNENALNTLRP
jgi:hypothetical protein